MRKQRKWLIIAALLLVVSIFPHFGTAEGNIQVQAEEDTGNSKTETSESSTVTESGTDTAVAEGEKTEEAASTEAAEPAAAGEVKLYPVSAVKQIAENDSYEMYIDEKTGNVRLVDRKTKAEWLGTPQLPRTTMPNNKKFMDAAVHIKYTEGSDTVQTYLTKEKTNKLKIESIENGAKVTFQFVKEKLEFAMEYRLLEDGFELTIPEASIKEGGKAKFVSIEPLPFWNAASDKEEGAIFLPDGSGALMKYRASHPQFFAGYSEMIYGADPAYVTQSHENIDQMWRQRLAPKEKIALPVFGNYRNGVGSLGIVTQGQYDAKVNGTPSGIRAIPYYRTSTEFVYRWNDVIFIGTSGEIPFFQGDWIKGDRQTRYVLLQDERADYVGMAQAYGKYLQAEQGVKPVEQAAVPLKVKLMGGILRDEVLGKTFISMTTFDQAREIIDAFQQKGIANLELTFSGWSDDGLYGDQPDHFPVEKKLGGAKELKALAAYAANKGVSLYLEANYARAFSESDGMKKNKDAIRGMDREVAPSTDYYIGSRWNRDSRLYYWMKPERVISKHLNKELDDYAKLGISGVHLAYWGDTLYSDIDAKSLTARSETASAWVNAADAVREAAGGASVDYGFAYMLGHIDGISQAPLDSSHFIYNDETVPFYQIAVRGLVPYSANAINLRNDAQNELLRMVEYGALPSLELTYEPTTKLQRTMEDRLWSSEYTTWLDDAAKQYKELEQIYTAISNQAIADHEQLGSSVYRTTYANGTKVIVNYGSDQASIDGISVPAAGYVMQNGGK
ncbi:DUF5696 domain-containing protein [Paenibacillus prosopidis]|uniref:Glycosyl hydrolase family 101 n=1 Tax=Paenibacillus prosopidis TaxID=630520 RepID=A0A368W1M9_9BACL|nr:DUF5696 domain-containing protein [Paenibacillus prosopidis]RCW48937.1 hypothetical protein DFP97_105122 [Paenibacillus prosopidis]